MISILIMVFLYILQKLIEKQLKKTAPISSNTEMIKHLSITIINALAEFAHSKGGKIKGSSLWNAPSPENDIDVHIPDFNKKREGVIVGIKRIFSTLRDSNENLADFTLDFDKNPVGGAYWPVLARSVVFVTLVYVDNSKTTWMIDITDTGKNKKHQMQPVFVNGLLTTYCRSDNKIYYASKKDFNKSLNHKYDCFLRAPVAYSPDSIIGYMRDYYEGILNANIKSTFFSTDVDVVGDERMSALRRFCAFVKKQKKLGHKPTLVGFPFQSHPVGDCHSPVCNHIEPTECIATSCCGKNMCSRLLASFPRYFNGWCPFSKSNEYHLFSLTRGDKYMNREFSGHLATAICSSPINLSSNSDSEILRAFMQAIENTKRQQPDPGAMLVDSSDDEESSSDDELGYSNSDAHIVVNGETISFICGKNSKCTTCERNRQAVVMLHSAYRKKFGSPPGNDDDDCVDFYLIGKIKKWLENIHNPNTA